MSVPYFLKTSNGYRRNVLEKGAASAALGLLLTLLWQHSRTMSDLHRV